MILVLIATCEVLFWVFLLAGLAARYLARKPRLGAALLIGAPIVDAVLLIAVGIDLRNGATATWVHSLAAIYIGVSVAFGHSMIRWADVRFAHRFAGGPAPVQLYGADYARACWRDVLRMILAAAIVSAIAGGLVWWVDDPQRTEALLGSIRIAGIALVVELIWAVSYTIWPKRPAAAAAAS